MRLIDIVSVGLTQQQKESTCPLGAPLTPVMTMVMMEKKEVLGANEGQFTQLASPQSPTKVNQFPTVSASIHFLN